jgi:hypothetical protein
MPGIRIGRNRPDANDLFLPRGKLFLEDRSGVFSFDNDPTPLRFVGDASEFALNQTAETITHTDYRGHSAFEDLEIETSRRLGVRFVLDYAADFFNQGLFLSGQLEAGYQRQQTNSFAFPRSDALLGLVNGLLACQDAAAGLDTGVATRTWTVTGADPFPIGRWIELKGFEIDGYPALQLPGGALETDFRFYSLDPVPRYGGGADEYQVTVTDGSATVYDLGRDYVVDWEMGLLMVLKPPAGGSLIVTIQPNVGSRSEFLQLDNPELVRMRADAVRSLSLQTYIGKAVFISVNPADNRRQTGDRVAYEFHQVQIRGEGDFNLISEDWSTMSFTGLVSRSADPLVIRSGSPIMTVLRPRGGLEG